MWEQIIALIKTVDYSCGNIAKTVTRLLKFNGMVKFRIKKKC